MRRGGNKSPRVVTSPAATSNSRTCGRVKPGAIIGAVGYAVVVGGFLLQIFGVTGGYITTPEQDAKRRIAWERRSAPYRWLVVVIIIIYLAYFVYVHYA